MDFVKVWILPPFIGAIIGYFTNWLAIKMLFRPYKTIRIAGIPLPFTPGILPREKDKLAVSLGDTVAKELLTPQVFMQRFQSPDIQKAAAGAVKVTIEGFLSQSAESLFLSHRTATPNPGQDESTTAILDLSDSSSFSGQVLESLRHLATSSEVQASMRPMLKSFFERLGEFKVRELLTREQFVGVIERLASSGKTGSVEQSAETEGKTSGPLFRAVVELPPDATVQGLSDAFFPGVYTSFLPYIEGFLRSIEFRGRLEMEARAFVKKALNRLGPVQRLFVSIAGYDDKISQAMPGIIDDLIQTFEHVLRDPATPRKISEALGAALIAQRSRLASQDLSTNAGLPGGENILNTALLSLGKSPEELRRRAGESYDRLAELPLQGLTNLSVSADDIAGFILSAFVHSLGREGEQSSTTVGALFVQVLREFAKGRTLAEFFGIGENEVERISRTLAGALLKLIETRIPLIVETLNVRSMVAEKIDSIDMKEAERIVLQVVRKELAWITWLGGILGAMIGIVQSVLSIL